MAGGIYTGIAVGQAEQSPKPPRDDPGAVDLTPEQSARMFNGVQNPVASGTISREEAKKIDSYIHDPNHGGLDASVIGLLPPKAPAHTPEVSAAGEKEHEHELESKKGRLSPRTSPSRSGLPSMGM